MVSHLNVGYPPKICLKGFCETSSSTSKKIDKKKAAFSGLFIRSYDDHFTEMRCVQFPTLVVMLTKYVPFARELSCMFVRCPAVTADKVEV